jgi:hypothetical protein
VQRAAPGLGDDPIAIDLHHAADHVGPPQMNRHAGHAAAVLLVGLLQFLNVWFGLL